MAGRSYNPGYMGYPALFFLETLHQNRGDRSYVEKMESLHARFSYLNAWMYDAEDKPKDGIPPQAFDKMAKVRPMIEHMFDEYQSHYENPDSCDPDEKTFLKIMRDIREWIDQIAVITKIVDNATPTEEAFKV